MERSVLLARSSLFFLGALIGIWIFFAGIYSLALLFVEKKATILENHAFISGVSYFFAARETLNYLKKRLGRLPGGGEYKIIVIISALISLTLQNTIWWATGTSLPHQERAGMAVFILCAVALGYLDLPPFKYRNSRLK